MDEFDKYISVGQWGYFPNPEAEKPSVPPPVSSKNFHEIEWPILRTRENGSDCRSPSEALKIYQDMMLELKSRGVSISFEEEV